MADFDIGELLPNTPIPSPVQQPIPQVPSVQPQLAPQPVG